MPRRKNPGVTLLLFLALIGAGWASYHYLYVERVFASDREEAPESGKENTVRQAIAEALRDDACFVGITSLAWRTQEFRWRVDVDVAEGCREQAKSIARRVNEIVKSSTGGGEANVFCYTLGQEVARLIP
jgi:hypothetical protein